MTPWRRGLQQIGGRNAISIWSWVITIPLTIVVSSTYAGSPSLTDVLTWQSIVLAVQVLLGGVMWVAARTILPTTDRRSRPVTAVAFFAFLGLVRALLLQWSQDVVGISGGVLSERLAVNIVGAVVALSVIAIIVDDYRTDEVIVQRLDSARATLARLRDQEEWALRAADIEVLAQVQARVEGELALAGADPGRIRAVADDIVRPISHELADAQSSAGIIGADESSGSTRLTFGQAFGRMEVPSPLAVAVIVEATILGAVAVRFGALTALANAVIGGSLISIGCWLIKKVLPLPKSPVGRIVVLALALTSVGVVVALAAAAILPILSSTYPAGVIGVTGGVAGAGIALSLWASVNAGRRLRQEEMARAVADEASAVERLRSMVEQRRLQAARFLHGAIQGELVAASLRGDSSEKVRDIIGQRFAEYATVSERRAGEQIDNVVAAWSTVLDIEFDADSDVWVVLDDRPGDAELFVDALSEALTNVVRHATGRSVQVRIVTRDGAVVMTVGSQGSSGGPGGPGIGLAQLQARGLSVSLESDEVFTTFTATI